MRISWLAIGLALGLLFQLGCDSKTDPDVSDPVVPAVDVEPGVPEYSEETEMTPLRTPAEGSAAGTPDEPSDELRMPPEGAAEDVPEEPTELELAPVEDGAAAEGEDPEEMVAESAESESATEAELQAALDAASAEAPEPMTIGSTAPPLDVEHWVSEGFEPVTDFEDGKVYVVEFWATWCGPCLASMPHLAEIQKQYQDQGVRLISVSDEDLETVEKFLEREVPSEESTGQTFGELTSVYSLTTDPDGSTNADYMQAANQNGIPTAFIVGKTGQIEWIGHPMTMDEPLEKIVSDEWDREAYLRAFEIEEQIGQAKMMARRGQAEPALEMLSELDASGLDEKTAFMLMASKLEILSAIPEKVDQFASVAAEVLEQANEPMQTHAAAYYIYHVSTQSELDPELLKTAISETENAIKEVEGDERAFMLNTVAHLHESVGDMDAALAAQEEAVETASGRMKDRLKTYLEELQEKANPESGEEAAEGDAPADENPEAVSEEPATSEEAAEEEAAAAVTEEPTAAE